MRTLLLLVLTLSAVAYGKIAPDFPASLVDGNRTSLREQLKPGRYLLLSFWASWCTPCIDELRGVSTELSAKSTLPLDVFTVNVDTADTAADVKPTIKMNKFQFAVALDPTHEIFPRYHNDKTLPYSVLLNDKGEIVRAFNGYDETMFSQIKALITGTKHAAN